MPTTTAANPRTRAMRPIIVSRGVGAELIGAGPAGTTVLFMAGGYAGRTRYQSTESDKRDRVGDELNLERNKVRNG